MYLFKNNKLNINYQSEKKKKNRFRLRFHTAIVIKLLEKAIRDLGYLEGVSIKICNDFNGHFNEIKDIIFKRLTKIIPSLKEEDIVQTKFQKSSLIDDAAKSFREKDKEKLEDFNSVKLDLNELINIIKKQQ